MFRWSNAVLCICSWVKASRGGTFVLRWTIKCISLKCSRSKNLYIPDLAKSVFLNNFNVFFCIISWLWAKIDTTRRVEVRYTGKQNRTIFSYIPQYVKYVMKLLQNRSLLVPQMTSPGLTVWFQGQKKTKEEFLDVVKPLWHPTWSHEIWRQKLTNGKFFCHKNSCDITKITENLKNNFLFGAISR